MNIFKKGKKETEIHAISSHLENVRGRMQEFEIGLSNWNRWGFYFFSFNNYLQVAETLMN